jgi:hypothetical protein
LQRWHNSAASPSATDASLPHKSFKNMGKCTPSWKKTVLGLAFAARAVYDPTNGFPSAEIISDSNGCVSCIHEK